jgi:predicted ester cyclase
MKKMFLLASAAFFLFSCNDDKAKDVQTKTATDETPKMDDAEAKEERNKQVIMASMTALAAHDVNGMMKDAAADVKDLNDGSMPVVVGIDSSKAGIASWFAAFPDVKGDNLVYVADGDYVMVWGDWTATFKKDFMGMKATGKSYKMKDVDVFRFNSDGKIIEHHFVQSPNTMMAQIK